MSEDIFFPPTWHWKLPPCSHCSLELSALPSPIGIQRRWCGRSTTHSTTTGTSTNSYSSSSRATFAISSLDLEFPPRLTFESCADSLVFSDSLNCKPPAASLARNSGIFFRCKLFGCITPMATYRCTSIAQRSTRFHASLVPLKSRS